MEEINCVLNPKIATKEETEQIFQNVFASYHKGIFNEVLCRKMFVADRIFKFTCYDDDISLHFGEICTDVVKAIKNKTTFEYIEKSHQNYIDYIMVVNLLDWAHIIDWGTSIRGAWFDWFKVYPEWPDAEISEGVIDWVCEIE